jgi:hypothetical protein
VNAQPQQADQDWRLQAHLDSPASHSALQGLLGHLRGPHVISDVKAAVAPDVVITHNENTLFAYAASEDALAQARGAIEAALQSDGVPASIVLSRWDEQFDRWLQTDPPPTAEEKLSEQNRESAELTVETRTLVASVGKMIRPEVEQTMTAWAQKLGLKVELIEHPHLLTSQVAFTVTGPKHEIDEFRRALNEEERQTIRAERQVMVSQL